MDFLDCNHENIEWGEDDEMGVCLDCGGRCHWHWEEDAGNVEEYYWNGKERVIDSWEPKNIL